MKTKRLLLSAALLIGVFAGAKAQYWEMANQVTSMLQPALSGSFAYKGYVDAGWTQGVGNNRADVLEFTTTQGFKYSTWFFMGVGAGVDVLFAHTNSGWGNDISPDKGTTQTGVMIPLFSDFRFNLGNQASTSFYIDLKIGASFLVNNQYLRINNGYLSNSECFYLRPSVGVRVPLNKNNPKLAANIGVNYQLITSNYIYHASNDVTLSSFGLSMGLEW